MDPKPRHLGPEYASQFADPSVVAAYRHRPAYPEETLRILLDLGSPETVLDAGCGDGALARGLAPRVTRVDAVDPSPGMIAAGRRRAGGDHPAIRWIEAPLETAPLDPPYDLVTAGQSLHWMDWSVVFPLLRRALAPGGMLAVVARRFEPQPWDEALRPIIARYSTNRDFRPYDIEEELVRRGLWSVVGRARTAVRPLRSSLDDYVESHHSANGFSRDRMAPDEAAAFDERVRSLVAGHLHEGEVVGGVSAEVIWGEPLEP